MIGYRAKHLSWAVAAAVCCCLLAGAAAPSSSLPLTPAAAEAAQCKGASKGPRSLGTRRAARLVRCLVNRQRRAHGRGALAARRGLGRAARAHTKQMQRSRCFAHTCPGEPVLDGRLERAGYLPCGCRWRAAENIAWGKGRRQGSPRAVVAAWMRSRPHRRTLLERSFGHAGVGVRRGSPFRSSRGALTYTLDVGFKR